MRLRRRVAAAWALVAHSLSGRLLLLTISYVLLTEVLIILPTLGRYYTSLLESHIASAEIAILPFTEPGGAQLSEGLRQQLLARAGAAAVMLTRPDQRELFLAHDEPSHFDLTVDLRGQNLFTQIAGALDCLFAGDNRILHVVAATQILHAQTVEVITDEHPIRADLLAYSSRLVLVALAISLATGMLVFLSLYAVFVRPMGRLTRAMVRFHENPEDARRIVTPSDRHDEIGQAERELAAMQRDILGFLQQKARLAALGSAVAKIQHDLRNILASAQLASDRLARIDDPVVKRLAPRIVSSLDHAVALATRTMRFGRADEHPPQRELFPLAPLIDEVGEAAIAGEAGENTIVFENATDPVLGIDADREQLFRILLNLVRNAAEAVKDRERGFVSVSAARDGATVAIRIRDNGAGVPAAVRDKLFQPFAASTRSAGTGLGLAIARDLARFHGGDVVMESTGESGTCFRIEIPDWGKPR
ncbi:MAG TPA: HAMP domain-containing sensor histidine kinase [Rhizomicrobium sp.]|nr:HAMP domain-containing sensor histidine kinase [Rhizomicrobium sp.]